MTMPYDRWSHASPSYRQVLLPKQFARCCYTDAWLGTPIHPDEIVGSTQWPSNS